MCVHSSCSGIRDTLQDIIIVCASLLYCCYTHTSQSMLHTYIRFQCSFKYMFIYLNVFPLYTQDCVSPYIFIFQCSFKYMFIYLYSFPSYTSSASATHYLVLHHHSHTLSTHTHIPYILSNHTLYSTMGLSHHLF